MSFLKKIFIICFGIIVIVMLYGVYYAGVTYRMIIKPQWHDTISNNAYQNGTIEARFNILKSDHGIKEYGGGIFVNYTAGAQDFGWDYALIFRHQDNAHYYRLMASADRNELALWKPRGGFLAIQSIPISHFQQHILSLNMLDNAISVTFDGTPVFSYTDNVEPVLSGSLGMTRYGNAIVFSKEPKYSELPANFNKPVSTTHQPDFRLVDWRDNKWIFDGQEPIANIDPRKLIIYEAKLKKGYQPAGYWELFWKQYRGFEWYADKPVSMAQVPSQSDRIIIDVKSTTHDDEVTSMVRMTVTFSGDGSYKYDVDTSMRVNDGKTWEYDPGSGLEYLNFLAYNTVAPAALLIENAWQKNYDWILYTNDADQWIRQPINHFDEGNSANVNPYHGMYMYGIHEVINPTISLLHQGLDIPQKSTQLCMWAFDSHFKWQPEIKNGVLESGAYYTAHYVITNTELSQTNENFNASVLDPAFAALKDAQAPIYRRNINNFVIARNLSEPFNEWTWSGNYRWDTNVGIDDTYSIVLERNTDTQPPATAYVNTAGLSYFTRLEETPAGRYSVITFVKTEGFSGQKPTISIASKHPEEKPVIHQIDVPATTNGWHKVVFDAYLPKNTGIVLTLSFNGKGKVWFDNVSWTLKNKDQLAPIKEFVEKVFGYIKRRV